MHLSLVHYCSQFLLSVNGIWVDNNFGICGSKSPVWPLHKRIDLDLKCISLDEAGVHVLYQKCESGALLPKSNFLRELAQMLKVDSFVNVDVDSMN